MAFIGRLLYHVKQKDNLRIVPIIVGDTGTGKSTLLNVIKAMFAPDKVANILSTHEITFGLESKYEKDIILVHEVCESLSKKLGEDVFKQMACGEDISIPRKYQSAISIPWRVPIFLCGNEYISYRDIGGSVSRRLAILGLTSMLNRKI